MSILGSPLIIPSGGSPTPSPRLPAEYQEVEYIQTDGTAYIDTAAGCNGFGKVFCDFYLPSGSLSTNNFIWGLGERNGARRFMMLRSGDTTKIYSIASTSNSEIYATLDFKTTERIDGNWLSLAQYVGYLGFGAYEETFGAIATSPITPTAYAFADTIPIFAQYYNREIRNAINGTRCRRWEYYAGASFTLSRKLISCYRKSSGVIGMYDLALSGAGNDPLDNNFFINAAASGAFSKGADA